jgi:hypothetical protein
MRWARMSDGFYLPYTWISANPTFCVVVLTAVTVKVTLVTLRAVKVTVIAAPLLLSDVTLTVVPSLNVSVPPVTLSLAFGRS